MGNRTPPAWLSALIAVAPWIFAILVAASPALLAQTSSTLEKWTPVYIAGGMGGVVLELLLSRWRLEFPSYAGPPESEARLSEDDDEEAKETDAIFGFPFGPRVDIGFLGRFFTGGLAAVALIILGAVVIADESVGNLTDDTGYQQTIAWAIAIGASSPAVWRAFQAIVEARIAKVRSQLSQEEQKVGNVKKAAKKLAEDAKKARGEIRRKGTRAQEPTERRLLVTQSQLKEQLVLALRKSPLSDEDLENQAGVQLEELTSAGFIPDEVEGPDDEQLASLDRVIGALELLQDQL